ncbi:MAG: FUSC family protein [Aeromicrobium sp.]|uniref:FUSC family protein n=1 Tax=Aeromicrobium sp. TaxID=1871063 RepID=UPI0039E54DF2
MPDAPNPSARDDRPGPLRVTLGELGRWQRVEVDVVQMLAAGLAIAVPFAAGVATDRLADGVVATVGALLVSSSGQVGPARTRFAELAASVPVSTVGAGLGALLGDLSPLGALAFVAGATAATVFGAIRPSLTKAAVQLQVATIIGVTVVQTDLTPLRVAGLFAVGALGGAALTMLAYALTRLIARSPLPQAPARRSWRADLTAWWTGLHSLAAWHYPLRLASCLAVAMACVLALPSGHSTWILLTVIIVVQRDHRAAVVRTLQRGVGTALGIVVGALMLALLSGWAMVALVGVIGAIRGHLKVANYTAYTLAMTPLVVVILGLSHHGDNGSLMAERVTDTGIGCLISLLIGHALWSRIHWPPPA